MSERVIRWVVLVAALALAAAAPAVGGRTPADGVAAAGCAPGSIRHVGSSATAWAAVVVRPTRAFRRPGHGTIVRLGRLNVNDVPMVLGVLQERVDGRCRATWLHVALPIRPNGANGWVLAKNVHEVPVHTRITVDLAQRRVRLYRNGRLVLSTTAAVGSPATPTPLGRYYVNQRLVPSDPGGPFGPGAVGISAFSPVLTGWAQGGPIAIHGTDEPWSIGHAVSNGCIRIANRVLLRLFPQALAGTPVLIRR